MSKYICLARTWYRQSRAKSLNNGTPIQAKLIDVSTQTHSAREATVNTGGTSHGYLEGDVVTIAGVTGAGAPYYNGTFPIYSVATYTFKYYMAADPGASAGGAITCSKVIFQFDDLMRTMQPSTTIHLGPGVFQTRGFALDVGGWQAAAGQKIQGSGMYLTTLKIVYATVANKHYYAVANNVYALNTLDYFEASDFTVDCNLGGQPVGLRPWWKATASMCAAIKGWTTGP